MCLVQMETEPVVASEPLFSAAPSAQVACHVPAIPNGSSTQAKPEERSGRMTAEQLAAIEDEELLDKMVLHTQVIILDDLYLKAPLCNKCSHAERLCITTKSCQLCEGIFGKVTAQCCVYAQCYVRIACINRAMPLWLFVRNDLSLFFLFFLQLDESKDFEERKMIRAAMRDLRKRKRGECIKEIFYLLLQTHERFCSINLFFFFFMTTAFCRIIKG